MNTTLKNLNKMVVTFLNETKDNQEEAWMSTSVQSSLKSILNKKNDKKDPNTPKRAKSAYLYFCLENRSAVQTALGKDSKATDITKELGVRWNALKENPNGKSELSRLEKLSQEDKKRYTEDIKTYVPSPHLEKSKKKNNGPKRANSAYLYFCTANREFVRQSLNKQLGSEPKATLVTKELGTLWNKAKAEGKTSEYDNLALIDKERYFSEKSGSDSSTEQVVEKTTPKTTSKTTSNTTPKKPVVEPKVVEKKSDKKDTIKKSESVEKKTAPKKGDDTEKKLNGYQTFCSKRRPELKKEFPDEKTIEITKRLANEWKNMSKDQQQEIA